ncbi:cobalt ABC transporter substrate-binding protein [Faecalispora anaeroviscerum]|uniref:cobalt ABC transporter substrate-binding protein n=1 Tax=Faecalispora anaeroviscerum TaxID=2991836 RepID=UPI0024BBD5E7|nr:cobalt ABC transporter substrate-binding protein [Faecalispora anaeroviscerum]
MKNIVNNIFLLFLILSIVFALGLVAIQIVSVITMNGALAIWAKSTLQTPVCVLCSISALVAFLLSYLSKTAKED